jgi:hypothetical protein
MQKSKKTRATHKTASSKTHIDYKIPLSDYHPNHDLHMCNVVKLRNMKTVAELAKDAQYICFICGRAAKKKEHLCEPVAI